MRAQASDRLACYDEAVGRLKAAEEAGELTTISKAEVEEVQRDAFGFSLPSLPKLAMPKFGSSEKAELNSMVSGVSNISKPRVGGIIVTLENGQVWTQIDSTRVSYSKRKGVKEAEVKTASFGSFMMKLDGGTAFRVRRLK